MTTDEILIKVRNLKMHFPQSQGIIAQRALGSVKAVDGISFDISKGETLGLVGESGCGKSTTARAILQLYRPTAGEVYFRDVDLTALRGDRLRQMRRHMQMIFQDPYASLNPRMSVGDIVAEPLIVHSDLSSAERQEKVHELFNRVGLNPSSMNRYPHQFSGGQRQRVGVARALAMNPDFIVCDEAVAALDVSIQAQIINLLGELQEQLGLTYLFIAHDLSVVRHISDRVAVMYLGKIVELASQQELYTNPLHPYTKILFSSIPIPDPKLEQKRRGEYLTGDPPNPADPPKGCNLSTRCSLATAECRQHEPELRDMGQGHWVACFRA
ncbi:MAG: ATP-binding cassette domain-containing protein [Gammaproteobacteria bacterium]|nr:ATP-binding cassette domain-containing protein [Gammaproteobacteria bacterium]